ncbi:MAG: hypothetical protein GXP31_01965 [Kiritimatiellaeota bacterium]|nr:hypothetical protein [Kiritimatiellota bacterium]
MLPSAVIPLGGRDGPLKAWQRFAPGDARQLPRLTPPLWTGSIHGASIFVNAKQSGEMERDTMNQMSESEQSSKAVAVLTELLRLLGLSAAVRGEAGGGSIVLHLETEEAGRLIGRRGVYLDNLELLVNRIVRQSGAPFPRVTLQVKGYQRRERQDDRRGPPPEEEDRLRRIALDLAKEVKRWGEPAEIGPFSARERRIIHLTLRDDPGVDTQSGPDVGGGRKKVIVTPVDQR